MTICWKIEKVALCFFRRCCSEGKKLLISTAHQFSWFNQQNIKFFFCSLFSNNLLSPRLDIWDWRIELSDWATTIFWVSAKEEDQGPCRKNIKREKRKFIGNRMKRVRVKSASSKEKSRWKFIKCAIFPVCVSVFSLSFQPPSLSPTRFVVSRERDMLSIL